MTQASQIVQLRDATIDTMAYVLSEAMLNILRNPEVKNASLEAVQAGLYVELKQLLENYAKQEKERLKRILLTENLAN